MSTFPDALPEPRKIFLGFLIQRLMETENSIFIVIPPSTHALSMMLGIIYSLDENSKKSLKDLTSKLIQYRESYYFSQKELEAAYITLTDYLHKNYLQEISMGIVQAASLPTDAKPPDKQAIPARLSAKL